MQQAQQTRVEGFMQWCMVGKWPHRYLKMWK